MDILKTESDRRGENHDEDEPLKVWAVHDMETGLAYFVPLSVEIGLRAEKAAATPEEKNMHLPSRTSIYIYFKCYQSYGFCVNLHVLFHKSNVNLNHVL